MSHVEERYIGLAGTGNETELTIVRHTERAYQVQADDGATFWMPKSAFDDDGSLKPSFYTMFDENYEKSTLNKG